LLYYAEKDGELSMVKQMSEKRLYNSALYYLSKYDASGGKVRMMLQRKLLRAPSKGVEVPENANEWIENVVQKLKDQGYIQDERYAQNQIRILSGQGKSSRYIAGKLQQAGVEGQIIEELIGTNESDDLMRAQRLVEKKKMGYLRIAEKQAEYYKKDLAALARAGFSYGIARQALAGDEEEF
jgi:regulatory protein